MQRNLLRLVGSRRSTDVSRFYQSFLHHQGIKLAGSSLPLKGTFFRLHSHLQQWAVVLAGGACPLLLWVWGERGNGTVRQRSAHFGMCCVGIGNPHTCVQVRVLRQISFSRRTFSCSQSQQGIEVNGLFEYNMPCRRRAQNARMSLPATLLHLHVLTWRCRKCTVLVA